MIEKTKKRTLDEKRQCLSFRTFAVLIVAISVTTGCGLSKPAASDIEPYVMNELGQCPLWTISDVRKVDGMENGNTYRVDFTAKLTLKVTPEQAMASLHEHAGDQTNAGCRVYLSSLAILPPEEIIAASREPGSVPPLTLAKQYAVSGVGILVKSEQGWRLSGRLQPSFNPT